MGTPTYYRLSNNKSMILLLILMMSCSLLACEKGTDMQKESMSLLKTDIAFSRHSIENGTANAFKEYLTEESLQFTGNGKVIKGNQAIYNYMMAALDTVFVLGWEPKEVKVSKQGDMGYTWGNYFVYKQLQDGELDSASSGKYVNIWLKQSNGSWKVSLDIGSEKN